MSVATDIFGNSADVLCVSHGDDLILQPQGLPVTGYAEDVSRDNRGQRLSTAEVPFTHAIHVRRSLLDGVTLKVVSSITQGSFTYRVKNLVNDQTNPEVEFQCVLV